MSMLMFDLKADGVALFTDTLAVHPDLRPRTFASKVFVVPHLDTAIVALGSLGFGTAWAAEVNEMMLCRDTDMLDHHTPAALKRVWERMGTPGLQRTPSTVFHFGFSERRQQYVGYAYWSERDFASEPLDQQFGVIPSRGGMPELPEPEGLDWLEYNVAFARNMREFHAGRGTPIGGDLLVTVLEDRRITTKQVYRWPDFDDLWVEMNAGLDRT